MRDRYAIIRMYWQVYWDWGILRMTDDLKTVEEVAKTTGKAIDIAQNFGHFISKYISGSLEQGMGIFEDKLKYTRWERQMRLMKRAEEFMKSTGMDKPDKPLELKFAVPLLQAATLEENDYLQDLWAKLLVNSVSNENKIELTRSYIDILERLTPFEAKILEKIYSLPFEEIQHGGVNTTCLPEKATVVNDFSERQTELKNEEVLLALANLSRLGCVTPTLSIGGGQKFSVVTPTILGKYFIEACTLKNTLVEEHVKMVESSSVHSRSDILLSEDLNNKLSQLNVKTIELEIDTIYNQAFEIEQKDRFGIYDLRSNYEKIISLLEKNPSIKSAEFRFDMYIKLATIYFQFASDIDLPFYDKIKSYLDIALNIGKTNEFEENKLVPAYKLYVGLERKYFKDGGNRIYFLNKIFEENIYDYLAGIELAIALDRRNEEKDIKKEMEVIRQIIEIDFADIKQSLIAHKDLGGFNNLLNSKYRKEFLDILKS